MAGFTLQDLEKRVQERAKASADVSYTRKLLDRGVAHCAKKLGEEAVETVIAAIHEDDKHLTGEAADLLYHLLVVLHARGISLAAGRSGARRAPAPVRARGKGVASAKFDRNEFDRNRRERKGNRFPEMIVIGSNA